MRTKLTLFIAMAQIMSIQLFAQINYFGQTPPGNTPVKFAENIISKAGQSEVNPMFTPDGKEFYFAIMDDNNWSSITTMVSKYIDGSWTTPENANISVMQYDWTSVFSKNGDTLFHSSCGSDWQYDIFYRTRTETGWSEAISISPEINDFGSNLITSIASDGTIYFRSTKNGNPGNIYYARSNNGAYNEVVLVDAPISTNKRESHPTIAPDNSYMIFYRGIDSPNNAMYISFRKEGNRWTQPVKTGLPIHSGQPGAACITPDNQYLIYQGTDKDFYWVALENLIDSLRNVSLLTDTSTVNSTFIGSHGYFLESSNRKVALDAHIYWEGSNYGYIKPTEEIKNNIENAIDPFNNIDLIMVSHSHADHFNSQIIESSMNLNSEAQLIVPPNVYDILASEATNIAIFDDRIWVPELDFYQSIDTVISDIYLTITCIEHGQEKMPLYVYSFELDGIRFTQLNSWNSITGEMYDTLGFNQNSADIAFLGYDYIMNNDKFNLYKNYINPKFSTISHIDGATSTKIDQIQAKVDEYNPEYPMNLMTTPGDMLITKQVSGTLFIDTIAAQIPSSIEPSQLFEINVFPNPASKYLQIDLGVFMSTKVKYQIFDMSGKTVKQGECTGTINVENLNSGQFLLQLSSETKTFTKKVTIE